MNSFKNIYIMVFPKYTKHKFDFSDIYHNCVEGYNWSFLSNYNTVAQELTTLCSYFNNSIYGSCKGNFFQRCQLVTYYLYYIKNNKSYACCIYFYYKLKDLLNNYGCKCNNLKNCYDEMVSLSKNSRLVNHISLLFSQCSDYPFHLDDEIFLLIFKKMDEAYYNLKEFTKYKQPQVSKFLDFNQGMEYLRSCQDKYNYGFEKVLTYFNKSIKDYLEGLDKNNSFVKAFFSYDYISRYITGELSVVDIKPQIQAITGQYIGRDTNTHTIRDTSTDTNTDNGTQISTVVTFSFFAILLYMFILYKYTSLGSYLQPKTMWLRKIMKRKNKKHMNQLDSYENMYNESNDKQYKIAYRSI
ncbi:variable surface protein [Plasmodium gonderi]|uniref:Variable surface protein n=1 Tax=Plasmodium gonderi TaxID=77519 RepID=A0A1Y1JPN4_PLAGO|nr:variable surface protein [Plasmodium gonderi]GAW82024.1 variable surface protein [Plasmodium gonderi]